MKRLAQVIGVVMFSALYWTAYPQTAPENLAGDWFSNELRDAGLYADVMTREVTAMATEIERLRVLSDAQATTIALLRAAPDYGAEMESLIQQVTEQGAQIFALTQERDALATQVETLQAQVTGYLDRLTAASQGSVAGAQAANPYEIGTTRYDWWEYGQWYAARRDRLVSTMLAINGLATDPGYTIPAGKLAEVWSQYQ